MTKQINSIPRVALTRVEIPDYHLGLRGKLLRRQSTSPDSAATFCTITYGFSLEDEVTDTSFSSAANGYPDTTLHFDESTRIELPWRGEQDAVIADLVMPDGSPFGASPRGVLQNLLRRYERLGIEAVLGYEFEFWIFHAEDRTRASGSTDPIGRVTNAYSLTRIAEIDDLVAEFIARMASIGITIEAFHSELGPGLFEFTMAPQPALIAADAAIRARQFMRELCAERSLLASFMAKPYGGESGAGGHIHSSLVTDGNNIFATQPGVLSDTAKHYLAGQLALMPELMALFAPYINSYKRVDPDQYVSNVANWATESRAVACRVLLHSVSSARVEHRVAGADVSPYFSAIALLAGGLYGLEQHLALHEHAPQHELPDNLRSATELFAASARVRGLLGDLFVDAVSAVHRNEVRSYEQWLRVNITEWERTRHLEHH